MRHGEIGGRQSRRAVLAAIASSATLFTATSASASEDFDDAPLSDLARQIRTGVVRGARLVDKADKTWERFSDDRGLGAARNRPKRNVLDAGGNQVAKEVVRSPTSEVGEFDEAFAAGALQECDEAFLSCLKAQAQPSMTPGRLMQQIEDTKSLVRKSFFASSAPPSRQEQFNFECYAHYRTYNEILVQQRVNFLPFRRDFESLAGRGLLRLAEAQQPSLRPTMRPSADLAEGLRAALAVTDAVADFLQTRGLASSWERSVPSDEDVDDFASPAAPSADGVSVSSDLPYSLALYGDATLDSQLLLQELGYRLYPSFGRWLVREGASRCFPGGAGGEGAVSVQCDDYYMDTAYNSNPDLFEVRQVLLNIVIQRD
ncbi:hypothetical protein ACHAXT_009004 [Thalassiosira profunda]